MRAASISLAAALALLAGGPGAASAGGEAVCRGDRLGYVACAAPVAPPPRPRPVFRAPRGLPWMEHTPAEPARELIPSGRRDRLGVTQRRGFSGPSGSRCREDRLGSVRCP